MSGVKLLHASVDPNDTSELRILVGGKTVKYLNIDPGTFEVDDMCFEPCLVARLPPLPPGDWITGYVSRSPKDGQASFTSVVNDPLPTIADIWHSRLIDHLDIQWGLKLRTNVYEAMLPGSTDPVVVKIARFPFEIPKLAAETRMYRLIEGTHVGPAFFGHITENGRVIGFAMERIPDTQRAGPEHLTLCRDALVRLHQLGILHGDVNRYNFLIRGESVTVIDYDVARQCNDPMLFAEEIRSLQKELHDESGRGGSAAVGRA